jgi:MFS family permease
MSTSSAAASNPVQLRRAVTSSFLGSLIEYYDFLLYATASAVIFGKVFFSDLSPLAATVASFGTFATGYLARPLGGLIFGHFGDRLGRKRMLVLTMSIMGVASTLIGVLPTYDVLGAFAPMALVVLRVLQGVAVGGEWGGAVLMSVEHARGRRGLWTSFTGAGAPLGMVLSTIVMTVTSAIVGDDAFVSWGWRIPFLLSIVLLAIGLFVRARVEETPVFTAEEERAKKQAAERKAPLLSLVRDHPKPLLLGIGIGLAVFALQGTLTTFLLSYGVHAGFERQEVLNGVTISSCLAVVGLFGWSALSDRVGRRPVMIAGAVVAAVFAFLIFPLVDSGSFGLLVLALVLGQSLIHPMMYGPMSAMYTELFATGSRYTGASLGYQLAGLGAGLGPLLFAEIQNANGGGGQMLISVILAAGLLLTMVCALAMRESHHNDLVAVPGRVTSPADTPSGASA